MIALPAYARQDDAAHPEYAAPNPADPKVTVRVGTILLAMSTDAHSVSLRDAAFLRSLIIGASEPTLGGNLSGDPGASPSIHLDAKIISVLSTTAVTRPSQIAALVSPRAASSQASNACRTSFRRTWPFRMSDACPEKPFPNVGSFDWPRLPRGLSLSISCMSRHTYFHRELFACRLQSACKTSRSLGDDAPPNLPGRVIDPKFYAI